jgi:hypothetical protein
MMDMNDFNRRFAASRRSRDRMMVAVKVWFGIVGILAISGLGLLAYVATTTTPEDIGALFGRVVAGFNGAAQ